MRHIVKDNTRMLVLGAVLAMSSGLSARDPGNFDINVATSKQSKASAATPRPARQTTDVLGRAAFTWVQQDLPANAKASADDPEAAARAHLSLQLSAAKRSEDVAQSLVLRKFDRQNGGAQLVQFQAKVDGIGIFREDLALLMDANQRLIAMRGPLPDTRPSEAKSLPWFKLDAAEAIAAALSTYQFDRSVVKHLTPTTRNGDYQHFQLHRGAKSRSGATAANELRAKPVYYRTRAGLQPAWYVETQVADASHASVYAHGQVVSAIDGSLLFRINHVVHLESYNYRVWAENSSDRLPYPSPQGRNATPDPDGLPTNNTVSFVAQELRSLINAPFSRSATDPWLPDGATVTKGNNANAYADLTAPDGLGAGDFQPTVTSANTFDYLFDANLAPAANATQTQAAAVQLFYWVNWLHDWFYDYGFAESDGNAQLDNYGRGGLAGDAMRAEAQDESRPNNASMLITSDGFPPRMQMGVFGSTIQRDSSVDGNIVAHEWGHYFSDRLVYDAYGLDTLNARGMGEGWGDFVALLAAVKEEDRLKPENAAFSGAYGMGSYSKNRTYNGLRRYPFSTDVSKSPLSLRHIVEGSTLPSLPPPAFLPTTNAEIHAQGEIWALALWEGYAALLNDTARLSFADAQGRMKDYLVGGLKLTPASPTMTEARDAILATILARGESADFNLFTAAFAKRGLGAGAIIPDRYSETMNGTVESKALGADIAVVSATLGIPSGCDADATLDLGETAKLTVELVNTGFVSLSSASVTLSTDNPAITFPAGATLSTGAIEMFGSRSIQVPIRLNGALAPNTRITVTATPDAPGINTPPGFAATTQAYVNLDEAQRVSITETFDTLRNDWTNLRDPAGTGTASWRRRLEATTWHWHGSDENSNAVTWTQTPVMAVGSGPLSLTLSHRYSFERDTTTLYDGGVIQASTDGGATWSNIDAAAAGYSTGTLSDCCGNPLAGQRAFTAASSGFPQFRDQVINLGSTYANQPNFRLRFGIATDAAATAAGWDIDVLTIAGLTDTPFNAVVPQSATCSVASNKALQGAMSGTYSSSARSGEGVLVDFGQVGGTPVVFFTWYTYDDNTEQQWLVGSNVFAETDTTVAIDVINTRGANFGSGFHPEDVARNPWGSVALTFPTCDTMILTYQKAGGEAGALTLSRALGRLEVGQCNLLQGGQSGTYYSTSRSGEGVLIDFGQVAGNPIEFFTWYTYGDRSQQWLVGSQSFAPTDSNVSVDLINTSGASFGNAFRPQDVVRSPWGRVTHRFIDCNTLELSYQKTGGESGTQVLTRALGRLGDGVCR